MDEVVDVDCVILSGDHRITDSDNPWNRFHYLHGFNEHRGPVRDELDRGVPFDHWYSEGRIIVDMKEILPSSLVGQPGQMVEHPDRVVPPRENNELKIDRTTEQLRDLFSYFLLVRTTIKVAPIGDPEVESVLEPRFPRSKEGGNQILHHDEVLRIGAGDHREEEDDPGPIVEGFRFAGVLTTNVHRFDETRSWCLERHRLVARQVVHHQKDHAHDEPVTKVLVHFIYQSIPSYLYLPSEN